MGSTSETVCTVCQQPVYWYHHRTTNPPKPILIGGKNYGDCACELTTWKRDIGGARHIAHAAGVAVSQ